MKTIIIKKGAKALFFIFFIDRSGFIVKGNFFVFSRGKDIIGLKKVVKRIGEFLYISINNRKDIKC